MKPAIHIPVAVEDSQAIAERMRQGGCSALLVWVLAENPARAFYERLGGRLVGGRTVDLGEGVTAVEADPVIS